MTVAAPPLAHVEDAPLPIRRRWLVGAALVLALVAVGVAAELAVRLGTGPTPIRTAWTTCGAMGEMRGTDQPLVFDTVGVGRAAWGTPSVDDIRCVVKALNGPTDWLDSGQPIAARGSQTWDQFRLTWTQSPESGLDVTFSFAD